MSEIVMADQGQVKSRNLKNEGSDSQDDNDKQTYDEIERYSDLYIFNQLADHGIPHVLLLITPII